MRTLWLISVGRIVMEEESVLSPPHVEHLIRLDCSATPSVQLDTQDLALIATKTAQLPVDGLIRDFSADRQNTGEEQDILGNLEMLLIQMECLAGVKQITEKETVNRMQQWFIPSVNRVIQHMAAAFADQLFPIALPLASMVVSTFLAPRGLLLVLQRP